jgi:hypothetical protein
MDTEKGKADARTFEKSVRCCFQLKVAHVRSNGSRTLA